MKHNGTRRHNGWTWGIAGLLAVATIGADVVLSASADAGTLISCTTAQGCTETTTPVVATNNSSGAYGNPARYDYLETQTSADCVEESARLAMDAIAGHAISHNEAAIDAEAIKLGIGYGADGVISGGSSFDAANVRLFAHYGFAASKPHATSRATVEADLNRGDAVTVTVWAGALWGYFADGNTSGTYVPGAYVNSGVYDQNWQPTPDHAVVVEAINRATGAVTIGDSGIGASYTVPWAQFSAAWSAGGYAAMDVRK